MPFFGVGFIFPDPMFTQVNEIHPTDLGYCFFQKFGGRFGLGETQREDLGTVAKLVSRCAFGPEILILLGMTATALETKFFFFSNLLFLN